MGVCLFLMSISSSPLSFHKETIANQLEREREGESCQANILREK